MPLFDQYGRLVDNKDIQNYFDIYGVKNDPLNLDESTISDIYITLSKRIHPDLFSSASNDQKKLSLFYSELVNNGYKILRDPFQRAKYYLEIQNEFHENKDIPPEILDDIFDIQDILEKDELSEADQQELDQYVDQFKKIKQDYINDLSFLFKQAKEIETAELNKKMNDLISANSYVQRIFININTKLEQQDFE